MKPSIAVLMDGEEELFNPVNFYLSRIENFGRKVHIWRELW